MPRHYPRLRSQSSGSFCRCGKKNQKNVEASKRPGEILLRVVACLHPVGRNGDVASMPQKLVLVEQTNVGLELFQTGLQGLRDLQMLAVSFLS